MQPSDACVVMVTAPNRLAACVQLQAITSHYWWDGKITSDAEQLMLFKTAAAKFDALRDLITSLHSYDTPEILQLPVTGGAENYLAWIARETAG